MRNNKIFNFKIVILLIIFIINCNISNAVTYTKNGKKQEVKDEIKIYQNENVSIELDSSQYLYCVKGSDIIEISGNKITGKKTGEVDIYIKSNSGNSAAAVGTTVGKIKIEVLERNNENVLNNYIKNETEKKEKLEEYKKKIKEYSKTKSFSNLTTFEDKLLWMESCIYNNETSKLNNLAENIIENEYKSYMEWREDEWVDGIDSGTTGAILYNCTSQAGDYLLHKYRSNNGLSTNYNTNDAVDESKNSLNNLQGRIDETQENIDGFRNKINILRGGEERETFDNFLDALETPENFKPNENKEEKKFVDMLNTIVSVITSIAMVLAVIVPASIGLKYMLAASSEEKADYKKDLIPYIVGGVMVFGISTIVKILMAIGDSINNV